jgi:type II secretory pathway pseudopilin PulG
MAVDNRRKQLLVIAVVAIVATAAISLSVKFLADDASEYRETTVKRRVANATRQSNGRTQQDWEGSLRLWQKMLDDATAANDTPGIEQAQQKIADAERNIARLKGE